MVCRGRPDDGGLGSISQHVEVLDIEPSRLVQPNEVVVSSTVCIEKPDPVQSPYGQYCCWGFCAVEYCINCLPVIGSLGRSVACWTESEMLWVWYPLQATLNMLLASVSSGQLSLSLSVGWKWVVIIYLSWAVWWKHSEMIGVVIFQLTALCVIVGSGWLHNILLYY